jgi:O-antigen ligase
MTSWLFVIVAAPFVVLLVVVCLREPLRVALPLYTALIPFGGALSIGTSAFGSASSLMGVLLALGLVAQFITGRQFAPRFSALLPIWTLFLGLAVATALWSVDRSASLTGLTVLSSLVVVFLLLAVSASDRAIVRRTETALIVGSTAAICYGIFQLLFQGGLADDTGAAIAEGGRFGNGLLGPNILAVTLLIPFAITINRAFNPRDPGRALPNSLLAALLLLGVLMTGSRTGILGAGAVALTMVWVMPRGTRRGLTVSLLVGAAVTVFVWTAHPLGLAERTFESTTSSSGRLDIWEVGLAACSEYCGTGSGWGTFPDVYAETQAAVPGARVLTGQEGSYQPHNLALLAAVETGVAGLVLLLLGLAASGYYAWKLPPEYRPAALGALMGLVVGVLFLSSMEFKMFWLVPTLISLYRNAVLAEQAAAKEGGVGPPASRPATSL